MRCRLILVVAALLPLALLPAHRARSAPFPQPSPALVGDPALRLVRDEFDGPGDRRPRFDRPLQDRPRFRRPFLEARDDGRAFQPPPPPLPPLRLEQAAPPPPPYFGGGGAPGQEDFDTDVNDPAQFVSPPWLPEWISVSRQRGYSDEELALILERHPRLGRFVRRCRLNGFKDKEIFTAMGLERWHAIPAYAASRPIPLPPSRTGPADAAATPIEAPAPPSSTTSSVTLDLPESVRAEDGEMRLSGKVKGEVRGASVYVDGAQVPVARDGSFTYRRGVPIGTTEVKVEAHDRQGRSTEALVTVSRDQPDARSVSRYEPLNPRRAKGTPNPKAVALIIGIDHYESSPRAEFAEDDANAFYDYATRALGVPADRIKLLTGAKARRLSVEKSLLAWAQPLIARDASDVYVFFSGHGLASDDGKEQYLLPYDAERSLLTQSAIRRKDMVDTLVGAGARSVTLFLDTCYSGGTRGEETLVQAARPILISVKEGSLPSNVTILAAAARDQLSSSLAGARHGLFSYYLMKGLEGAAAEDGQSITAQGLEAWLLTQVPGEAAKLGRSQTPELLGDGARVLAHW